MTETAPVIAQIRAFNRFYVNLIGLLDKQLLSSNYSLAEVRVLYEIQVGQPISASRILATLHLDKGYLSRVLKKLEKDRLIYKQRAAHDARTTLLSLTPEGVEAFTALDYDSNAHITTIIRALSSAQQHDLVQHMQAIHTLLLPTA